MAPLDSIQATLQYTNQYSMQATHIDKQSYTVRTFRRMEHGDGEEEVEQVALPQAVPQPADHLRGRKRRHPPSPPLIHVPPQKVPRVDVPIPRNERDAGT